MIAKSGETRQDKYTAGTYDAIQVGVYLQAAATNTALVASDFAPENITVKVLLRRQKQTYIVMQDNLLLLGTFNTLAKGAFEFYNGIDLVYAAVGVKNVVLKTALLKFGGPIRVNAGDELIVELSVAKSGVFTSNVDSTISYVEFEAQRSIGYEIGIFNTKLEVVQSGTTKQSFSPGDNVTDIALLNFDMNDMTDQVANNLSLSSDRLDLNLDFLQMYLRHVNMFSNFPNMRYGSVLPISASDSTGRVYRGLDQYPQSMIVLHETEVDACRVDISFNSANVAASQNYLGWRSFVTSQEILLDAEKREQKHFSENVKKQPATL